MRDERQGFSARLQQALSNADYSPDSPTQLARHFNARHRGKSVTVHAARKWLVGEAIPTQEKLRILADWLGVSAEWLRFGTEEKTSNLHAPNPHIDAKVQALFAELAALNDHHRTIVQQLIRLLLARQT